MKHSGSYALVGAMLKDRREFKLAEIYKIVCKPPHIDLPVDQLHSRCSRYLGEARKELKKQGYVLLPGELRNSYRVEKRHR